MSMNKISMIALLLVTLWAVTVFSVFSADEGKQVPPGERDEQASDAKAVLERLKLLEGTWNGEGGTIGGQSSPVVHEFRVAAGGSVVMEMMDPEGEREVNMYHLDGDDLVMTHYCGGGSQPTLRLDRPTSDRDRLSFTFVRSSNLKNPAQDRHIHAGKLVFLGPDQLESWWTVYKGGKELAVSKFMLQRGRP
jgi:hypothetical protein